MIEEELGSLEVMILKKRIEVLKKQGLVARLPFDLGQNFLDLMDDKWIFDGVVQSIHAMQEMYDPSRDDAVGNTLPSKKKKRGRKSKKELAEMEVGFDDDVDEDDWEF